MPLSREDVATAVAEAALAPSVLNVQPWRFVATADAIELHRDPDRTLPVLDPNDRALTVSCGAALFNLRLAVACVGRHPDVVLLPSATDPTLLARVTAGHEQQPRADDVRLHEVVAQRRTSRVPFEEDEIPLETRHRLEAAADLEGASLAVLDEVEAARVAGLVHEADLAQRWNADVRAEVRRWTGPRPGAVDGIPDALLGPRAEDPSSLVRDFAYGAPVVDRPRGEFEIRPLLAVLLTKRDDRLHWLRAGQALERVWLEATAADIAISLLTQPLEQRDLRWLVRPSTAGPPRPQALLRLGRCSERTPATPRRPVEDLLTFA